jgi:acyl-CoA thioesterase
MDYWYKIEKSIGLMYSSSTREGAMHLFEQDISLSEKVPFHCKGYITDNWSINNTPNGGYLLAVLASAMLRHSEKRSTPIVTANYISRCSPGEADLHVEEFSRSKQFNRFQVTLIQDGTERIRALGTFSDEKNECFLERYETRQPEIAPLESCISLPEMPKFNLLSRMDIRLDPHSAGWMQGTLSDISEMKGWISFKDARTHDLLSVLLMADCFPPPVFASQGMMAWVPTIELSVNVRKIPESTLVKGHFRSRFITCGLVESDGELWDEEGNLVAISRQIAQFRKSSG